MDDVKAAAALLWKLQDIIFVYKICGVLEPEKVVIIAASQGQATDPVQGTSRRRRAPMVHGRQAQDVRSVNKMKMTELMNYQVARAQWTTIEFDEARAFLPFFDHVRGTSLDADHGSCLAFEEWLCRITIQGALAKMTSWLQQEEMIAEYGGKSASRALRMIWKALVALRRALPEANAAGAHESLLHRSNHYERHLLGIEANADDPLGREAGADDRAFEPRTVFLESAWTVLTNWELRGDYFVDHEGAVRDAIQPRRLRAAAVCRVCK